MNQNFIFVFILLATFFIVYAIPHKLFKRETTFGECTYLDYQTSLLGVKIFPDPVVNGNPITLSVTGQLDIDMPKETILAGFFGDLEERDIIGGVYQKPVCADSECPKFKTPFNVTMVMMVPDKLPDPYSIIVSLLVNTDTPACAIATVSDKKHNNFAKTPSKVPQNIYVGVGCTIASPT
ncbi:hypothetical protein C1645_837091 [Glomus cerebriforme]|uniref:MD-2-related lipid-recognition domain-containing protein n=1 Tax=Glomus cerebriforme TaxID=658196 RepID=A0A397S4Q5_9GLOM|nr:hypothetical protein C1645_837091 [Glomus cerebriforme]